MLKYLATFQVAAILFYVLKLRFIGRALPELNSFYVTWGYVTQDILIWAIISIPFFGKLKRAWAFLFILIIPFVVNIIFITKTGYPMSQSLFSQVGDLMMLQTSIDSPSVYRNLIILIGSIICFSIAIIIIQKINLIKFKKAIYSTSLVICFVTLISYLFPMHQRVSRFNGNIFITIFSSPSVFTESLDKIDLNNKNYKKWQLFEDSKKPSHNKNVILIIVETLRSNLKSDVMPNLHRIGLQAQVYKNHYTSWPYSSKSLFSLLCAQPPIPSNVIEMRLGSEVPCQNWIGELEQKYNYKGLISYTGDLNYDNMKSFFRHLGNFELMDRNELSKNQNYKMNSLSIDDQSMVDNFEKFLQREHPNPYVSVFISMNSHFPFWDPDEENKHNDPYLNAMSYQDKIIGKLFDLVKSNGTLKDTIFVITGDHGRRESNDSTIIPESMYHIPLIVYDGENVGEVEDTSSHYEIGSEIVKLATGKDFGYKDFNLRSSKEILLYFETNEFLMSHLRNNGQSILNSQGEIIYQENDWAKQSSQLCNEISKCEKKYEYFKEWIINLKNLYEPKK